MSSDDRNIYLNNVAKSIRKMSDEKLDKELAFAEPSATNNHPETVWWFEALKKEYQHRMEKGA